jgi:acetyltransferase-like isoleucine patch superfamily enzyme
LVIGSRRLSALIGYECLTFLLTFLPGALGLLLRRTCYPTLFSFCGRGTVFGVGVTFRQPRKITLGNRCIIDDYASLGVRGEGARIALGDRVLIGRHSVLDIRNGSAEIGDDTSVGATCRLGCDGGATRIGRYVMIAAYCYIGGGAHGSDRTDIPMALQSNVSKGGVTIEDDVWIGAGSLVMDGVRIGRGSIVGAGSLVTRDIPALSIAFGSPARVVRSRVAGEAPPIRE